MYDIDWETIRKVTNKLPQSEKATKAKFTYQWAFTRTRGFLFNEEDQDTCPLCHQAKETNTHVARCMHEAVKEHQEEATKLLQSELKKIGTHTTVANTMTALLHNNNIFNYTHNSETDKDKETKEILVRQKKIGWSNWEYRWWTLAWNKTHKHQQKKYKHSKYSGGK